MPSFAFEYIFYFTFLAEFVRGSELAVLVRHCENSKRRWLWQDGAAHNKSAGTPEADPSNQELSYSHVTAKDQSTGCLLLVFARFCYFIGIAEGLCFVGKTTQEILFHTV